MLKELQDIVSWARPSSDDIHAVLAPWLKFRFRRELPGHLDAGLHQDMRACRQIDCMCYPGGLDGHSAFGKLGWKMRVQFKPSTDRPNIGALIITYTILVVPFLQLSYNGSPILSIKAPILCRLSTRLAFLFMLLLMRLPALRFCRLNPGNYLRSGWLACEVAYRW